MPSFPVRVLFVCLGNICRSPTAHGIFQGLVEQTDLADRIQVDSAGTADWHTGRAPDPRSQQAARTRGYDLSGLRARVVVPQDFDHFHYVLAMDTANLANLQAIKPGHYSGELSLFLDYGNNLSHREVPDPYYGGDDGFELVLDLVESASQGLLNDIRARYFSAPGTAP